MSRIACVQYTNPAAYPPLGHSSRMPADLSWNWLAHRVFGLPVVYHEHDSPDAAGATRFVRFLVAVRRRLAAVAEVVVLRNDERARLFARETGRTAPVLTVWNGPLAVRLQDGSR